MNLFELAARLRPDVNAGSDHREAVSRHSQRHGREGNVRDLTDPLFQEYSFQDPTQAMNRYPTVRVDYQLTDRHRLTYSMNFQYIGGGPDTTNNRDPNFPGFPVAANQRPTRRAASGWLRSMIGTNMVNEFRFGYGGAPVIFCAGPVQAGTVFRPRRESGRLLPQLSITPHRSSTPAGNPGTTSARDAFNQSFENTLNWQKGSHSFNFGGVCVELPGCGSRDQQIVPELRFGVEQGDPAEAMFVAGELPGRIDGGARPTRAGSMRS